MRLCECGCGLPTLPAQRTNTARGAVKGQPQRFISGHQNRGRRPTRETRLKMSASQPKGPDHHNWRGDYAAYVSLHEWVGRYKPLTGECQVCGATGYTENANISNEYRRDVSDYIELCKPCHALFDAKRKNSP